VATAGPVKAVSRSVDRSPRRARIARVPRPAVLLAIAVAGFAAAAGAVALAVTSDHVNEPGLQGALMDWVGLPYVLSGLIAWWRRPASRFGPLMVIAGFVTFAGTLQWTNADLLHTIGQAADLLPAVLFLHVFLAFPSGRLERRLDRWLVVTGYVTAIGLEFVEMAMGGFGPHNLLEVVAEPGAAGVLQQVQLLVLSALSLVGIASLAARRRRGGRPLRRSVAVLIDSFALGLLMTAILLAVGAFNGPGFETIRRVTFAVVGIAPVAFLAGLLSARLARSAVGELVVELRSDPRSVDLRDALARALRDPSLTLAYWLPEFDSWADSDGRRVVLPARGETRATTMIDRDGAPVAALVHDGSLRDEAELLEAVSAAAGIALENGRLHADLNARLIELRGSRGRMIEAGLKERQRLERNLHDGAQQRLIALSLELRLLERQLGADPGTTQALSHARREIALSLDELREVARGIHPAVVTGHGLAVALDSLAARASVPVRLTVELDDRLPEPLEVAAYYVICECLANIDKHAHATSTTIDVTRAEGEVIVEVSDDGVGGADTERGSGLRGIADRVEALGGRLRVWTPTGCGTRVRAEIPCA
jgi:signal transduction histidine kinase